MTANAPAPEPGQQSPLGVGPPGQLAADWHEGAPQLLAWKTRVLIWNAHDSFLQTSVIPGLISTCQMGSTSWSHTLHGGGSSFGNKYKHNPKESTFKEETDMIQPRWHQERELKESLHLDGDKSDYDNKALGGT